MSFWLVPEREELEVMVSVEVDKERREKRQREKIEESKGFPLKVAMRSKGRSVVRLSGGERERVVRWYLLMVGIMISFPSSSSSQDLCVHDRERFDQARARSSGKPFSLDSMKRRTELNMNEHCTLFSGLDSMKLM
jgi:hypothetical protein